MIVPILFFVVYLMHIIWNWHDWHNLLNAIKFNKSFCTLDISFIYVKLKKRRALCTSLFYRYYRKTISIYLHFAVYWQALLCKRRKKILHKIQVSAIKKIYIYKRIFSKNLKISRVFSNSDKRIKMKINFAFKFEQKTKRIFLNNFGNTT